MYHSITFLPPNGQKNTWDDWHLIPSSRPLFSVPEVRTNFIEIPGRSGSIDLTTALTGYPAYNDREGSFEFIVENDYLPWHEAYSRIMEFMHGQYMQAFLEDDPDYFYEGRFSVNEWRSEKDWSRIVIDYRVGPYKWSKQLTTEPWKWDPFNFYSGVIGNGTYTDLSTTPPTVYQGTGLFSDIEVTDDTPVSLVFTVQATGTAPQKVIFSAKDTAITLTVSYGIPLTIVTKTISAGTSDTVPGLILYNGSWLYEGKLASVTASTSSGTGKLSMSFRVGRL